MSERFVHSAGLSGIADLMGHNRLGTWKDYLCCSSVGCADYMQRDITFLIEGEALRKFSGDIGDLSFANSPKRTPYDEVHVANDYKVIGLYIPKGWDLEPFRDAFEYITTFLELPVKVISESGSQEEIDFVENWEYYNTLSNSEYMDIWSSYGFDFDEGWVFG